MARPSRTFSAPLTGACISKRARRKREAFTSSLDNEAIFRHPCFLFAPRTYFSHLTVKSFHGHRTRRATLVGKLHGPDSAAGLVLMAPRRCPRQCATVGNQRRVCGGVRILGSRSCRLSACSRRPASRISGNTFRRRSHVRTVLRSIPSHYAIPEEPSHARSPSRSRYHPHAVHRCFAHFRQLQSARGCFSLDLRQDRKSTRLNSSHRCISYAVFCLK